MPYKDPIKAKESANERSKRYRARKHAERYGPNAGPQNGLHGNQARGERNGRYNGGKMRTSQGYIAVSVPKGHHLRQAHGYAYEHQIVAEWAIGRRLKENEIVHHINGRRDDNRPENLEVHTLSEHAALHAKLGRDKTNGRFTAGKRH